MSFKNTLLRKDFTIRCKGKLVDLSRPAVMGIINVTDDSFYADSRTRELHHIIDRAGDMLEEGALMLDLGAQSTRPGAPEVGAATELERLLPAIHGILHHFPEAILSIDTWHASVAEKCIHAGAAIVNDVSAGDMDPLMIPTVAKLQVPFIAMHMQGTPADMQQNPEYNNVSRDILDYFIRKVAQCREAGIADVIIDPGFGFGKTLEHNYQLLKNLDVFDMLEVPVLVGVSRKSMIYRLLGNSASEALNGTMVVQTLALQKGAAILRVHDVKEATEATRIIAFMKSI